MVQVKHFTTGWKKHLSEAYTLSKNVHVKVSQAAQDARFPIDVETTMNISTSLLLRKFYKELMTVRQPRFLNQLKEINRSSSTKQRKSNAWNGSQGICTENY